MRISYLKYYILNFGNIIRVIGITVNYIKAGRFIDTERGKGVTSQIIVVDHDTIKAVGSNINMPAGATVNAADLLGWQTKAGSITPRQIHRRDSS